MLSSVGGAAAGHLLHEEEGSADHRSVPRGGQGVHPPATAGAATLLDLPGPHALLGVLDLRLPLPRHLRYRPHMDPGKLDPCVVNINLKS